MSYFQFGYIRSYKNKLIKKLTGVVHLRGTRPKKGDVLMSFLTVPFTFPPGKSWTDPHPHYFTCEVIAKLLLDRGYDIDVIDWNNDTFIPKKKYAACIDLQRNLERLAPYLNPDCKKVMHITASHARFQNEAEQRRIDNLGKRRGIRLPMARTERYSENARFADFLEGYGNATVRSTYGDLADKIIPIQVATSEFYDFPEDKDFAQARKHFLWFGGGGAILKGLDLVLEAFAKMPEYTITLVGPAPYEKEFEKAFAEELSLPNVKRYPRPKVTPGGNMTGGRKLEDIMKECAAIIFPSASEGAGASVVQAMQAGVIPIVTSNSGIAEEISHVIEPTVEAIRAAAREIAQRDPEDLRAESRKVWEFARAHHSRETYIKNFAYFIDNILKL
jgi:glycosyltransferase involved in cell wall biosynthesis